MGKFIAPDNPKNSEAFFKAIIRDRCAANIGVLQEIAEDPTVRAADRITAASKLVEWAIGKPKQEIENRMDFIRPIIFSSTLAPADVEELPEPEDDE